LVEGADNAQIGQLENGSVRGGIDGQNKIRSTHTHSMLDRAGNPGGDVQLGPDGLAGLTALVGLRDPPGVDDRSRSADDPAE